MTVRPSPVLPKDVSRRSRPWDDWRPPGSGIVELGTVHGHEVALPVHCHDQDQVRGNPGSISGGIGHIGPEPPVPGPAIHRLRSAAGKGSDARRRAPGARLAGAVALIVGAALIRR